MGYRNMKVYLERKGIVLSRITVHKYMNKELGLVSIVRRKKPTYESGEAHNVFVTYSNNRGKFLRHEEYTINLFGKKATALVVGSILAGVLVIAPEIGIPLGAKLVLGATSAGLIGASGTMLWNIRASVDVYSSPYRVGRHYTRFYGDFYTTDGEYITSLHWSKRGYH